MDKTTYIEQRAALLAECESLITAGKAEEAEAKMGEVEAIDNKWEAEKLAQANLAALKDKAEIVNLENKSVKIEEVQKMEVLKQMDIATMSPAEVAATDEYRNAYLKKLQGKALTPQENTVVSAASVIPTQTLNKIIEKLEQTSVLYPYISKSSIPGNLTLPRENAKNDAAWTAMGTAATDSEDSYDSVSLAAYKLIKTIEIGADVSVMAIPAFEAFLVAALAKKMAKAIDNAILNGTGSGQPTGLAYSGVITNTGTFTKAGMTFTDLVTIIADLPSSEYRNGAVFVMPSALYFGDVIPALATEGIGVDAQNALQYKILGYPVILDDYIAADTLIFGNLENYHLNWAQDITIENDKSIGFRNGSVVYRAMALADGKPTNLEAFNKYTRALS